MGRRRRDNTLNLFAFQDIITGVAGVMLFILLLLVVQMTIRASTAATEISGTVDSSDPQPPPVVQPVQNDRENLRELQRELKELRQRGSELLTADAGNLDARIKAAEAELADLMRSSADQKSQAEAIGSQMSSEATSAQKLSTLEKRNALRRTLEKLEHEQAQHAGGKLVAFRSASSGAGDLWMIDMRGTRAAIFSIEAPGDAIEVTYDRFDSPLSIVQSIRDGLTKQTKSRSVVVLLRPSIAGTGSEILDAFRISGFRVALEILDEETQVAPPGNPTPRDGQSRGNRR